MWSSRPFADPAPFIRGSSVREISFTSPTLDVPGVKSIPKGAMFAHSGFPARARSSGLERGLEPGEGLGHSSLELVGVLVGPTERERGEDLAQHGEPAW